MAVYIALYKTGELKTFDTWEEASPHVIGNKNVVAHKKFNSLNEKALDWVKNVSEVQGNLNFNVKPIVNEIKKEIPTLLHKRRQINYTTPIDMSKVPVMEIYCDGGSFSEGQEVYIGAWAFCYELRGEIQAFSGTSLNMTNYKAELLALRAVLSHLHYEGIVAQPVKIFSDNQAVVKGYMEWIEDWSKKEFRRIKYGELWEEVYYLKKKFLNTSVHHVSAHTGVPLNELADRLCTLMMREYVSANPKLMKKYGDYVERKRYKDVAQDNIKFTYIPMDKLTGDIGEFEVKVGLEKYFEEGL